MPTGIFIRAQLALLAWREGRDSGLQSMQAIAPLIVNRQKAGRGTLRDCIKNYPISYSYQHSA